MRTESGVVDFSLTVSSRINTHAKSSTWSGHDKRSPRTIRAPLRPAPDKTP